MSQDIKDAILKACLPNVVFDGWTWEMVCKTTEDIGYSVNIARGVFPEKMVSVLDHFADWADRSMLAAMQDNDPQSMRVRDRIHHAVMTRLEILEPYKDAVGQSSHFWMLPSRKARALKITWRTADVIWGWAGDQSTDYNRYTKRGLLSGVIASTMVFWIRDKSDDLDKSKAFLDRRIENVMQLGKFVQTLKSKVS
ncbi:MAG: COQ9 family protein [Bdellovibrionales bacterium]